MHHYTCSNCHTRIPHKVKVCPTCGARLTIRCQLCGFSSDHDFLVSREPPHYLICPECLVLQDDSDANSRVCPQCLTVQPFFRKPQNREEAMWGGQTCQQCGFHIPGFKKPAGYKRPEVKQCPACLRGIPVEANQCTFCGRGYSDQEVAAACAAYQAREAAWAQRLKEDRQKTRKMGSGVLRVLGGMGLLAGLVVGVALVSSFATSPEQFGHDNSIGLLPTLLLCSGPLFLIGGGLLYLGLRSRRAKQTPQQASPQADGLMNPEPVPQPASEKSAQLEKIDHD